MQMFFQKQIINKLCITVQHKDTQGLYRFFGSISNTNLMYLIKMFREQQHFTLLQLV